MNDGAEKAPDSLTPEAKAALGAFREVIKNHDAKLERFEVSYAGPAPKRIDDRSKHMSNDTAKLALDTIDSGAILKICDAELKRLADDVIKNPLNTNPRKLTIAVTLKPSLQPGIDGKAENYPEVSWSVSPAYPKFEGGTSVAYVKDGEIHLNLWDAGNPNQMGLGLPDEDEDGNVETFGQASQGDE